MPRTSKPKQGTEKKAPRRIAIEVDKSAPQGAPATMAERQKAIEQLARLCGDRVIANRAFCPLDQPGTQDKQDQKGK